MTKLTLSFQLWTSRAEPSLDVQFEKLAGLGYRDVQFHHNQYEDPSAVRRLLVRHGLTAKSGHIHHDLLTQDFPRAVAAAHETGVTLLIVPFVPKHRRPTDGAGWSELGRSLASTSDDLASEGIALAWHNHPDELRPLPDGSYPIDRILGDRLQWEIDIGWLALAGADPATWFARYGGRIPAIHVKDILPEGTCPEQQDQTELGKGILPLTDIWQMAVDAGAVIMATEHDATPDYSRFAQTALAAMRRLEAGLQP